MSYIPFKDLSKTSKASPLPKADMLNAWSPTHSVVNNLQQVEPSEKELRSQGAQVKGFITES